MSLQNLLLREMDKWDKLWKFVIKPTIVLLVPCLITIFILDIVHMNDFQVIPIMVAGIGSNIIWLIGFHKGRFLVKETKWYVWNRIIYGTLWFALLYGATLIALLVVSVLQNK